MDSICWYTICLTVGLALDWALLDRFALYVEALFGIEQKIAYKKTLVPRIFLTLISLLLVAKGSVAGSPPETIFYIGACLSIVSLVWGIMRTFR